MKHLTVIGIYLLLLIGVISGFFVGKCMAVGGGEVIERVDSVVTHDTLWQIKTDTLPVIRNEVMTHYIKVPVPAKQDSAQHDSISMEVVKRTYSDDSTYIAWISGIKWGVLPRLDSISVNQRTIITEREITKVVTRKQPLTMGLQVGAGYGLINNVPDIFIGVGVQWHF